MRTATIALVAVAAIAAAVSAAAGEQRASSDAKFQVIVHEDNRVTALSRKFVADAFLKKTTRWSDDDVIEPVDQKPRARVRQEFSRAVLKRSVAAVRSYWRQIVFSGRGVPPPELDGDDEVVEYVRQHRDAIGYVSADADVSGVRVVQVK